ncbi:MAG: adenylate/guanylate cyclase domain-containing protein [Chitinophagaceae bacterium]
MQQQQRHLAAILFTDIVGYTGIMQKDEALAVAVIRRYNAVLEKLVTEYHGEVVNNYGDGSLCTFSSTTDAVRCAILIQEELLKSDPPVPLRIGLHVGELIFEDGKAFGDGVNIASRIQSLGQANTILFSKEVFDKIRNQPGFKSLSLGNFEFKNVDEPVEVFALANEGLNVPNRENMEGKLKSVLPKSSKGPQRKTVIAASVVLLLIVAFFIYSMLHKKTGFTGKEKSIAVLPFINMSEEKGNEYFSDGMTEEITTQLSKIADLKVIARTSSMLYKGSKKSIREIAEELCVASILEGSVQKIGNDIRITAQLIDANSQQHIWADKYDRDFKEVFAIQSEVAQEIAHQLNARLTKDEKIKIEKAPTINAEAYEYYLQGSQLHISFWETRKLEYFDNSRTMFGKALALDPGYALAHAGLADLYNSYTGVIKNLNKKDSIFFPLQLQEIEKAWKIDSTLDYINNVRGSIEQSKGNKEAAFGYSKKAVEINPNSSTNLWGLAILMGGELGLVEEAKLLFDRAVKLDPLTANNFLMRGYCHFILNNPDDAIRDQEIAIKLEPDFYWPLDLLADIYSSIGRFDDAKKMIAKSLQIEPEPANHTGGSLAYAYARLGNKEQARKLLPDDWQVLLALGMKEDALKTMPFYNPLKKEIYTPYLIFKYLLATKNLEALKNDPRFLKIMERSQELYEENKKKFSIAGLIN